MVQIRKPLAIVMDIEGTTTSMRFWSHVLVPFIRAHLHTALWDCWPNVETQDVLYLLYVRSLQDDDHCSSASSSSSPSSSSSQSPKMVKILDPRMVNPTTLIGKKEVINSVVQYATQAMSKRLIMDELKSLQLLVWLFGYRNQLIKSHIYPDVSCALYQWKHYYHIRLFTFATGHVCAQKLLFAYSIGGNLVQFIEQFFDSSMIGGDKFDPTSYGTLADRINVDCKDIVFLSDNVQELYAAHNSGYNAILVCRSHNHELASNGSIGKKFKCINSFLDLEFL